MPYTPHDVVKSSDVVGTAVGLLEQDVTLPALISRQSVDQFKGRAGDSLTYRVDGLLPARRYEFRNDRSNPLIFDAFAESTTSITFGDRIYSAVQLTDEQADFDLNRWGDVLPKQTKAVARGLTSDILGTVRGADYNAVVGVGLNAEGAANFRLAILKAKGVMDKFHAPAEGRVILAGVNVVNGILMDPNLTLTSSVAQERAESALANAVIGKIFGFTIVQDVNIGANEAYIWSQDAFVMYTGAPSVPADVRGATTTFEGYSLRWIQDYDVNYLVDRSVVDVYCGSNLIKDFLIDWTAGPTTTDPNQQVRSEEAHFVRAIKLELGGTAKAPTGELATFTKVTSADVTVPAPADAPAGE